MSIEIASVRALEILDSRGRPTVSVTLTITDGQTDSGCESSTTPRRGGSCGASRVDR